MQQSKIYFFGKLNQCRDFIVSENLQTNDKNFWDGWFDRCNNQDKLIPFTRKTLSVSRIWLFCIKLPDSITYIGLTALSSDQTGRQYPFVLFQKPCPLPEQLKSINFFSQNIDFFNQTLINGKCIITNCLGTLYKSDHPLPEPFLNFLSKSDKILAISFCSESGGNLNWYFDKSPIFIFN